MKKSTLFIFCLFLAINCFGQTDNTENQNLDIEILKSRNYEIGIYKNFKEFQDNNPSNRNDFMLKERNEALQALVSAKPNILVVYDETTDSYERYKEKNWGICDGRDIYIKFRERYFELSIDGKYSYFLAYGYSNSGQGNTYYEQDYLLNLETNETIYLKKSNLIRLLEIEDAKLLEEFKNEKRKKTKLKDYVEKINNLYK